LPNQPMLFPRENEHWMCDGCVAFDQQAPSEQRRGAISLHPSLYISDGITNRRGNTAAPVSHS
jgi:hypothetical protein